MEERTEDQKLFHDPIVVVFAGKEYKIKPLPMKLSREWRQRVHKLITEYPKATRTKEGKPEEFGKAIENLMVNMPDELVNLFFDYARDLPREEIEAAGTDNEFLVAWGQVMEIGFPLLRGLATAIGILAPPPAPPATKKKSR